MAHLTRITRDPRVMGGRPCIRGMRVTVGTVVGLVAAGRTREEILREYPYLEQRGWIAGRWVEKSGERRRRFYRLTAEGKRVLAAHRDHWREFVRAIALITGVEAPPAAG